MFYGCRNPWVDFKYKYKFIIFSTRILTVLKLRTIMYLEIRKGIKKGPSVKINTARNNDAKLSIKIKRGNDL